MAPPTERVVSDDWHTPTELPDLRRAGVVALDTETRDDRLRADKGSGWATARAMFVVSALLIAKAVIFARTIFRFVIPIVPTSIRPKYFGGCTI